MTSEQEMWAVALWVEKHHGEGAFLFASMRADALEADGELEGAKMWRSVLKRLNALERCGQSAQ